MERLTCRLLSVVLILVLGISYIGSRSANAADLSLYKNPPPADLILLLDNSGSMRKTDPGFLIKRAVESFINGLSNRDRLAIVIFDERVNLSIPLTPLTGSARNMVVASLEEVDYSGQLTNIPTAVEKAINELKVNARREATRTIVLLTDGIVDTGNRAIDRAQTKWLEDKLTRVAADNGIKIFGVALSEQSDIQLLQTLAHRSGGGYFRDYQTEVGVADVLNTIYDSLNEPTDSIRDAEQPIAVVGAKVEPPLTAQAGTVDPLRPETIPETDHPPSIAPEPAALNDRAGSQLTETPIAVPHPTSRSKPQLVSDLPRYWIMGFSALVILLLLLFLISLWRQPEMTVGNGEPSSQLTPTMPKAFLVDLNGIYTDKRHELKSTSTLIGRTTPNREEQIDHVAIDLPTIGRRHAVIEYQHHGFWLTDQNSVNGTFVNNQRISEPVCLKHGDQLRFYNIEFEFLIAGMEEADGTIRMKLPATMEKFSGTTPGYKDHDWKAPEDTNVATGNRNPIEKALDQKDIEVLSQVRKRPKTADELGDVVIPTLHQVEREKRFDQSIRSKQALKDLSRD